MQKSWDGGIKFQLFPFSSDHSPFLFKGRGWIVEGGGRGVESIIDKALRKERRR